MQPYAVSAYNCQETNPWWYWGLAIFIAIMAILSGFNALATGIIYQGDILEMDFEQLDPGPYPENGSSSEKQQWNETTEGNQALNDTREMMKDLKESGVFEMQMIFASMGCLSGLIVVGLLTAKHDYSFHIAGIWVGYSTISAIVLTVMSNSAMANFYQSQEYYPDNMETLGMIAGISQVLLCNLFIGAIIFLGWMNTRANAKQTPESGFHQKSVDLVYITPDLARPYEAHPPSPESQVKTQLREHENR